MVLSIEERKKHLRDYAQRPEVKARKKAYWRVYLKRPAVIAKRREYYPLKLVSARIKRLEAIPADMRTIGECERLKGLKLFKELDYLASPDFFEVARITGGCYRKPREAVK